MTQIKKTPGSLSPLSFRTPEPAPDQKIKEKMVVIPYSSQESDRVVVLDLLGRGQGGAKPPAGTHRPHQRGTGAVHTPKRKKKARTHRTPKHHVAKHPGVKPGVKPGKHHGVKKTPQPAAQPTTQPQAKKKSGGRVKLPPFSTNQKTGDVSIDGLTFTRRAISPEASKLAKLASNARMGVQPSALNVSLDAIKLVSRHPKSISVGVNGAKDWSKQKDGVKNWVNFMHDALMAGIDTGPQLSPKFDAATSGISIDRVSGKKAALDLVGELLRTQTSPSDASIAQTKTAAGTLLRAMLTGKGQRAYEVVWHGPNGASARAIIGVAPKTGLLQGTALLALNG